MVEFLASTITTGLIFYVIGILIGHFFWPGKGKDGDMIIDFDDPTKDVYTLCLNIPLTTLQTKRYISIRIRTKNKA